jgi:hypothetical protein
VSETTESSDVSEPHEPGVGLGERVKNLSVGALVGWAVAILVVGLVVGLGAGYLIEKARVQNDIKNLKKKIATTKAANTPTTERPTTPAQVGKAAVSGTVVTTAPGSVTMTVAGIGPDAGTARQFATTARTVVVKAVPGTASDIVAGSRVEFHAAGSLSDAQEVIVLPANAKVGLSVTSATPTSMTLDSNGKPITVNTKGATIDTVTTAPPSDITTGSKILVQPGGGNPPTATEVIVLPNTTKFVA